MLAIIEYGMGNIRSVLNAFEALGEPAVIARTPEELRQADAIVLPGVGAFGQGMANLKRMGLVEALHQQVMVEKKPFLGICLGLQILARRSFEHGEHLGLGWIDGEVVPIASPDPQRFRVPHMGWNDLTIHRETALFQGSPANACYYFVHSFHLQVTESEQAVVTASCHHGVPLVAAIQKNHIHAVQFHPEKSQQAGLAVLRNFVTHLSPLPC